MSDAIRYLGVCYFCHKPIIQQERPLWQRLGLGGLQGHADNWNTDHYYHTKCAGFVGENGYNNEPIETHMTAPSSTLDYQPGLDIPGSLEFYRAQQRIKHLQQVREANAAINSWTVRLFNGGIMTYDSTGKMTIRWDGDTVAKPKKTFAQKLRIFILGV